MSDSGGGAITNLLKNDEPVVSELIEADEELLNRSAVFPPKAIMFHAPEVNRSIVSVESSQMNRVEHNS